MAARTHRSAVARGLAWGLLALSLGLPHAYAAPQKTSKVANKKASAKHSAGKKTSPTAPTQHTPAGSPDALTPLPAVYTGTMPCAAADCPGVAYQLRLQGTEGSSTRGSYVLRRQTINSLEQTPAEEGPWRLSYDYGRLILGGGPLPALYAIKDRHTLVQLGIDGKPLDNGQNQLQRVLGAAPADTAAPTPATPVAAAAAGTLEATFWKLVRLAGAPALPATDPQRAPHLVLQPGEQRVTGSGGCNRFAGSFQREAGNSLQLTGIVSTRMACAENDKTIQEAAFFDALNQTRSYRIDGTHMLLLGEGGKVLAQLEAAGPR